MAKVKVYSTPSCHLCHEVKKFLKERGVEFEDINLVGNYTAFKEMMAKSGKRGVPQIEINGKMIVGFDKAALEQELERLK
jgi:glutaredoxin-like YruB-family protein